MELNNNIIMVGSSSLIASSSSTASPARPDHHLPFPNSTNGTNTTNPSNPQATPTLVETRVRKTTGSFTVNFNGLSGFPAETGSYTSSPIVEIDGKRWSVHIYPGGDSEETKGYLSCFIVNESQSTIRASFRITLVNQMNWKNRTLSSEEVKTFAPHGTNEWGSDKFIPLNDLKQPSNGHCVDDTIVIRVDLVIYGELEQKIIAAPCRDSQTHNNIPHSLKNDLSSMLFNPLCSDITIIVAEERIPAHHFVLALRSEVFRAMFSSNMIEATERV
eukprot:scaffold131_cov174-Ochromonas_danica.AAC.22